MGCELVMLNNFFRFIFSSLYFIVSSFYSFLFKVRFLKTNKFKNLLVVSVGNLTAGGSGKTPFVVLLSRMLSKQNIKHSIVSRGYKKALSGTCIVHDGKTMLSTSPFSCGDEPFMLACQLKTTPIISDNKKISC